MQNSSKVLRALAFVALLVLIGIGIGKFASRGPASGNPSKPPAVQNPPTPGPGPLVRNPTQPPTPSTNGQPNLVEVPTVPLAANVLTNWEDKLDEILGAEGEDTNKVTQLFEMFPHLPEEGQVEVAQHLSNLVEDDAYTPLGKLLANPKLPEEVLDVLMADLLNRPNSTKLPMFLELAQVPNHAKAEEAKDLLELFTEEEYGTDWNKWRDKIQEWLKANPDE